MCAQYEGYPRRLHVFDLDAPSNRSAPTAISVYKTDPIQYSALYYPQHDHYFTVGPGCSLENAEEYAKATKKKVQLNNYGHSDTTDTMLARTQRWDLLSKQFAAKDVAVLAQVLNNSSATALLLWQLSQSGYNAERCAGATTRTQGVGPCIKVSLWLDPVSSVVDFLANDTKLVVAGTRSIYGFGALSDIYHPE
jgi:hypothetical protein